MECTRTAPGDSESGRPTKPQRHYHSCGRNDEDIPGAEPPEQASSAPAVGMRLSGESEAGGSAAGGADGMTGSGAARDADSDNTAPEASTTTTPRPRQVGLAVGPTFSKCLNVKRRQAGRCGVISAAIRWGAFRLLEERAGC